MGRGERLKLIIPTLALFAVFVGPMLGCFSSLPVENAVGQLPEQVPAQVNHTSIKHLLPSGWSPQMVADACGGDIEKANEMYPPSASSLQPGDTVVIEYSDNESRCISKGDYLQEAAKCQLEVAKPDASISSIDSFAQHYNISTEVFRAVNGLSDDPEGNNQALNISKDYVVQFYNCYNPDFDPSNVLGLHE